MNYETAILIWARIKGFLYDLGMLVLTGLVGWLTDFLGSDAFRSLVTQHFGETLIASIVLMVASGIVRHIQNLYTLGALKRRFGAIEHDSFPPLV